MRSTPTASSTRSCSNAAQPRSESIPVVSFTTGTEAYGRGVGRYSNALAQALCDAAGGADRDAALGVGCGAGGLLPGVAPAPRPPPVPRVRPLGALRRPCP